MCPSHCSTSVSVYGINIFREPGCVGRATERWRRWASLPEPSQAKAHGRGKRVDMATLPVEVPPCHLPLPIALCVSVRGGTPAPPRAALAACCVGCPSVKRRSGRQAERRTHRSEPQPLRGCCRAGRQPYLWGST